MNTVIPKSLLITTPIMAGLLVVTGAFADGTDVVDEIGIGVPISCTLSGTGMSSHTATIPNGIYSGSYTADGVDYTDGIGSTTLKAMCNDNEGFAIYAAGYTGDEIGGTNSTNLVGTSVSGNSIIATGTATGPVGGDDVSNWAMKLDTITSPAPTYPITIDGGFNSYSAVPSSYTKVAHRDSATDVGPNGVGSTLTTTYAAYISKTQPADTYSGKVIYTLVHPANEEPLQPHAATPQCISYWPNASGVVDSMGDDCGGSSNGNGYGNNATISSLWASNFRRDGYGFAGWSDKYDWVINENDANGNGTGVNAGYHIYGPNAEITTPDDMTTKGLSLYAVWVPASGDLQSFTCPNNLNMPIGSITALKDQRDNNTYTVAKLADGKCWMTENLRLNNTAANNSDGTLAQGYHSSFIGLANPETADFTASSTANSLYSTDGSTAAPAITQRYVQYRFPRYNNKNTSNPTTNMTTWNNNVNVYSVGNWYTWSAAIADTTYYNTNNRSITSTSICPTGWRLPRGGDKTYEAVNDFWSLIVKGINGGIKPSYYDDDTTPSYSSGDESNNVAIKMRSYPNNFINSGCINGSTIYNRSTDGHWWTSTTYSAENSYYLQLSSRNLYPGTAGSIKGIGRSIRCMK